MRWRSLAITICIATTLSVPVGLEPSLAQTEEAVSVAAESESGPSNVSQFGGPGSVQAQIRKDQEAGKAPGRFLPTIPAKDWLERELGLILGADYNALLQHVSTGPGAKDAAGGVARLYGHWHPFNRAATDATSLVFKLENRHRLGTRIAPQEIGPTVGYAGLTAVGFSDAGTLLTNLYWYQRFPSNRFAFVTGIVDVTDYVDVYGLVNPWTDFSNQAFLTDPTIPAPNQGFGAATRLLLTPNYYVLGGVADANGDPSDPGNAITSFVNTHELFKHVELGWIGSWANRFSDNMHITAWQVDAREATQVDDGWGVALSLSREVYDRWTPFFRAGYSDGGGAILERSVSAGLGYQLNERNDFIGIGANWGRPPADATKGKAEDQYTFEAYYRLHVLPQVTITPDFQFIVSPTVDPSEDRLWIFGLRLRATL